MPDAVIKVSALHFEGETGVSLLVPMPGVIAVEDLADHRVIVRRHITPRIPRVAVGLTCAEARDLAATIRFQADEIDPDGAVDLQRRIRRAICDPGAFTPRERIPHVPDEYESIQNWGARAVMVVLAARTIIVELPADDVAD